MFFFLISTFHLSFIAADIGSLGLLCCYGDSSGSEGEEGGKEDGRQRGGEGRFEVPEVIQGTYLAEVRF